jgi:hypothetical protein
MRSSQGQHRLWVALGSIGIAFFISLYIYTFFIQTPNLSRREPVIAFLVFICLFPIVFLLLSRFILPKLKGYDLLGRFGWLLLSLLLGFLVSYSTFKLPPLIHALPQHKLEILIPGGDADQSVTLHWFSTSLGDIGFAQLNQFGDWEQTELGLTHTGPKPASLEWKGRTGEFTRLVFIASNSPIQIKMIIDDNPLFDDLNLTPGNLGISERRFNDDIRLIFPATFSLWISISFLFLTITLFLVHVSIRVGENSLNHMRKIENKLKPLSVLFFFNRGDNWWNKRDWWVIFFFFFLSVLFFMGRWNGIKPFVDLHSDAAYVSAYAASLDNPEAFSKDPLFNIPGNFGYYTSLQVFVIRLLTKITKEYGFSYILLTIPYVFLQLSGFYLLCRVLFKSRFFSFLLALISTTVFYAQAGDYWGIWYDPQPRMMFQSLFPFLLILVLFSLPKQRLRWLVIAVLGLLIYIHPVSIPAIAFSVWLGFLLFKPAEIGWKHHLFNQFLYALIFVLLAFPFLYQYSNGRDFIATKSVNYETARDFMERIFSPTFQIHTTFSAFTITAASTFLLPLAYIGSTLVFRQPAEKKHLGLILSWLAGIFFVCVGLSSFELFLESRLNHLPVFLDLIRGLRYTIPLMEILVLWPLALYWNQAEPGTELANMRRMCLAGIGLVVFILFTILFPTTFTAQFPTFHYPNYRFQVLHCLRDGSLVCPSQALKDEREIVEFIRTNTAQDASIISIPPTDLGGAIRFQAIHPIAFDPGDMIRLAPGNLSQALDMEKDIKEWSAINLLSGDEKLKKYLEFGRRKKAELAIIRNPIPDWLFENVIFNNQTFSLVSLE